MGKLTPTYKDLHEAKTNGGAPSPGEVRVAIPHLVQEVLPGPIPEFKQEPLPEVTPEPIPEPEPEETKAKRGRPQKVAVAPQPAEAPPQVAPAPALRTKIALVGTAPSSRMLAPFNDPSWEIWGCSPGNMKVLPRVDVWFELHVNLLWPENESYGKPYIEWLRSLPIPVITQDLRYNIPSAVPYPKDQMVKEFGREFFTSSFAWMMALAISRGATEIALYGIDMASKDEYVLQRPGFYHFKREAEKRGIKVTAPHESDILQPAPLYAFDDGGPFLRKMLARQQELRGRVNAMQQETAQLQAQVQQKQGQVNYLQGALEDLDYIIAIWGGARGEGHV